MMPGCHLKREEPMLACGSIRFVDILRCTVLQPDTMHRLS